MKATININKSIKTFWRLCFLLPVFFISSCIQPTIFSIQFPQAGETYIGNELVDFIIKYNKTVPSTDVYLNGVSIKNEFVWGPSSAKASVANLKKYLKQGVNSLTVDPLAFGPSVQFVVDNTGPEIIITKGKTTGGSTSLEVAGELRDVSGIASLMMRIDKVTAVDPKTGIVTRNKGTPFAITVGSTGKFSKTGIPIDVNVDIYNFEAVDVHGQISSKEFLADSNEDNTLSISNAVRIAVGDSFVESLRPIIASTLYTTLMNAPIDIRWKCWNDTHFSNGASQNPFSSLGSACTSADIENPSLSGNSAEASGVPDGGTFNPGLNPVNASILGIPMVINVKRIQMTKAGDPLPSGASKGSTVLLSKFKVQANNYLKIDMVITEMLVSIRIDLSIIGIAVNIPSMTMSIGRIVVDTGANVSAVAGHVHVELQDSNFALQNIAVSQTEVCLFGTICIQLGGLVDAIMPLLEGIIGDLLPGILNPILNTELQKIVIGACMYPDGVSASPGASGPCKSAPVADTNAKFNWAVNVETLKTDNLFGPTSPYDMIVGLETKFNLRNADPFITRPSLGPIYVEDPVDTANIYNSLGETGTNLTVAVSSNAINQAFSALYASGMAHFAIVDGVVTYGADPSKPVGKKDQIRIRLYPESSPFFTLNPVGGGIGGAGEAKIGYESAVMYLDLHDGTQWKEQLVLGVDFSIAASIAQVDNAVRLGISGSPTFNLRTMVNNTGLPVTQSMLQGMLDMVTMYFLPSVTDKFIIIDLSQIANTSLNGTKVLYQTDTDNFKNQTATTAGGCTITGTLSGGDGIYDYVCETINFVVNTNTLTTTGIVPGRGTNLLFQMEARDPDIPAAPAIPRLDLDKDNILDYKDNCAAPILMQVAAINLEGGLTVGKEGDAGKNIDIDGYPINNFANRIKAHINRWVAAERGQVGFTPGSYTSTPAVAGSGTPTAPNATDQAWWNGMRKGDTAINSLDVNYPWIQMIYSNENQKNTDGDRSGELCEDDTDRDGIYLGNGVPEDTCPTVKDISNNSGSCTIDDAAYVLFQNQAATTNTGTPQCLSHQKSWAASTTDVFQGAADANPPTATNFAAINDYGTVMSFKPCSVTDITQRFYVDISTDSDNALQANKRSFCGTDCKERVINIYTNSDKQYNPAFYDDLNHHYLATTIATASSATSNGSAWWGNDDVIVTTMANYDGIWREWLLSLSKNASYPFLIESYRTYERYGIRDCIYQASSGARPNLDASSCATDADTAARAKASFKVLLGPQQVEWSGKFTVD